MGLLGPGGAVGLEFDEAEVRVVELRGKAGAPTLAAWGRAPLPAGAVVDGLVAEPVQVGQALIDLWRNCGISGREVILGVVNQEVLVRFAAFPKVPRDKLANVLRYQAQEHLPIPMESAVWDYAVVDEKAGANPPLLEILLVAARRQMVDDFLAALTAARLSPRDIDVGALALLRLLPPAAAGDGATVLVHAGNGLSTILIVAGGAPRLVRFIPVSVGEVARKLGYAVAEVAAALEGAEPPEVLAGWGTRLEAEIRSSAGYYQGQPGAEPVEAVVLSGPGARLPGLADRLRENLGVPVSVLNPLEKVNVPEKFRPQLVPTAPDFGVSIGLARRGLEGSS